MLILISGFSARMSPSSLSSLFRLESGEDILELGTWTGTDLVVFGLIWSLIYHKSILSTITQMVLMIFRTYLLSSLNFPNTHNLSVNVVPLRRTNRPSKMDEEEANKYRGLHIILPSNSSNPPYPLKPPPNPNLTKFPIIRFKS